MLDTARAEEKVNAAKAADAAMTCVLEEQLAPVVADLRRQANATQVALAKVPSKLRSHSCC